MPVRNSAALTALLLFPALAAAHTGVGEASGFAHGFAHPVGGLDHVCAMVAVGVWAAQTGGRVLWAVPLTFVGVMALGGALPLSGIALPFVEQGIVLSVLLLGVLIAAAVRLPLLPGCVLTGLFALWHGHAHGAEMPASASGMEYALGFMLATALLHVAGIAFGVAIQRLARERLVRYAGVGITLCGVWLAAV